MANYRKYYSGAETKHSVYDGDHCVADHLTEQQADTMLAELTEEETIQRCKCDSTEFTLRAICEKIIVYFGGKGEPLTCRDRQLAKTEIVCRKCNEPYKP